MPVRNIRLPGNSVYYGKITGLDEDEKRILAEAGIGADNDLYDATTATILSLGRYAGEWKAKQGYSVDDIVLWNGKFYNVAQEIDVSETEPDKDTDHFEIFNLDKLDFDGVAIGENLEIKDGKLNAKGGGGSTEDSRIGDLANLKTNAKDTIVNSINEVEEETDNLAKVTPTDIKIVNDEITLMHDGTEITGQKDKIGTEATDLASLEANAELPSGTTATLLTTIKIGDTYYKIIEPIAVEISAKADATNGTITADQLATLQASDSNYVMFNHEKFFLNDDGAKEGFLTYTHVGHENSKTTLKFFTITVSTKAWVLTTQSVQTINVTENDDDTVSLEIS